MKLQILMSTYNGEKYLPEQLDSLLAQTLREREGVRFGILVRDDGSKDRTCEILQEYSGKYPEISFIKASNTGVVGSFFELLEQSDPDADYIAFCDQDDVWFPGKLERAVCMLEKEREPGSGVFYSPALGAPDRGGEARTGAPDCGGNAYAAAPDRGGEARTGAPGCVGNAYAAAPGRGGEARPLVPRLYGCRPLLTDETLNPMETVLYQGAVRPSFGNALVENIITGCTCVINRPMADILRLGRPEFTVMHDWWFYIVASCFGEVVFDTEPQMYYRQHGTNTVGVKANHWQELKQRIRRFKGNRYNISRQVRSLKLLAEEHGIPLSPEKRAWVEDILGMKEHFGARLRILKNHKIYRQRKGDDLIYKVILLLGNA